MRCDKLLPKFACRPDKTIMKILRILLCAALTIASASALADMYVDRSIVIFPPGDSPRQDVKVSNTGKDVVYAKVEVLKVEHPGEADEKRVQVTDPSQMKLLATPNKMVIPAGGQKLIRIVNLQQNNTSERVYRINVTPIVPPLQNKKSQLRIVVAYQILAIVQPNKPHADFKADRNGSSIAFSNSGNTNVLLSEGKQCDPKDKKTCQDLPSRRLYAGNKWTEKLPYDAPVTYQVRTFDGVKTQVFN